MGFGQVNSLKHLNALFLILAIVWIIGGCAYLTRGMSVAWSGDDVDLQAREKEWTDFKQGIYPNRRFTPEGRTKASAYTVYPAYAVPMFAPFFATGNFFWARVSLQVTSLIGLGVMMVLGWHTLRSHGWQAGLLGAALCLAISGNNSAFAFGQFSLISSGLLAAQILALRSNRCCLAGVCWAFAMIKPQIALPFALLFLLPKHWTGLLCGGAILAGLSYFALAWTGWSASEYVVHSLGSEKLSFIKDSWTFLGRWLLISPKVATVLGIITVLTAGLFTFAFFRKKTLDFLLPLAGCSAALGWVLFYHRQYDNQMLFPLMLAVAAVACRDRTVGSICFAGMLAFILYLPSKLVAASSALELMSFLVPVAAAVFLFWSSHALAKKDGLP